MNAILALMFRGIGIMKMGFLMPVGLNIGAGLSLSLFAFLIALLVARRIKRVSAYSLIKE